MYARVDFEREGTEPLFKFFRGDDIASVLAKIADFFTEQDYDFVTNIQIQKGPHF